MTREALMAARLAANAAIKAIRDRAKADARELTDQERSEIDGHAATFDALTADIERLDREEEQEAILNAAQPRRTQAEQPSEPSAYAASAAVSPRATVPASPRARMFQTIGDFAACVYQAAAGPADPRLLAVQAAAGDTITSTDGFPIPPDLRSDIIKGLETVDDLNSRCTPMQTASNEIKLPGFEAVPGTAGALQVQWVGEGNAAVESKLQLGEFRLPLHKLMALVPVTEEALTDAPLLDTFLRTQIPMHMAWALSRSIMRGSGAGSPLGILNAKALITVPKVAGQTADTVVFDNIVDMWTRCHPSVRARAVWVISNDVERQLMKMAFLIKNAAGTENVGGLPVYLPAGSIAGVPYATLMGRPVVISDHASRLGDKGDISLIDFTRYGLATKVAGVQIATSMHMKFDQDKSVFRFIFRAGGQPMLSQPITPDNGGDDTSAFVTLAERA